MAKSTNHSFWLTTRGLAAICLIGFASYFLLMEHRQHLFEFLPYLILLLCPLMHIFMHRGHSHGAQDHNQSQATHQEKEEAYRKGYEQGRQAANDNNPGGGPTDGQHK
jgi:hypothetical protein